MTTVLVIGGGIAAYCAALGARREGAEVTIVARAPGASALYSGAMEVVDDLEAILKTQPHHPLTRLKLDPVRLSTELDTAILDDIPRSRSASSASAAAAVMRVDCRR